MSKRVLIVSYYFPPMGGAGTQRAGKLCKYLPANGWDTAVLCGGNGGNASGWKDPTDESLAGDIPPGTRVDRIAAETPDTWVAQARGLIERARAEAGFNAAIVTMSPFWMAPLVEKLAAIVPTVVDLRDPWALDGVPMYRTRFGWAKDLARMRRTLTAASAVIMNTDEARSAALEAFPELDPGSVHAIQNGFDPEDLRSAAAHAAGRQSKPEGSPFRLVHTGTFLTNQALQLAGIKERVKAALRYRPEPLLPLGRSIFPVLRAIEMVRASGHDVRFTHAGRLDDATKHAIERSACADAVEALGYLPHSESVRQLLAADGLFLHLHGLPEGHRARIVPGKTYEYLASGRPVLAALPEGDARDLAKARDRCELADPCDPASIAEALRRMIEAAGSRAVQPLSDEGLAHFERPAIAARVAKVLDGLVGSITERVQTKEPSGVDAA